jgi:hypothetical protein
VYSTYLGGSGGEFYGDQATGITVGGARAAYVKGQYLRIFRLQKAHFSELIEMPQTWCPTRL